MKRSALPPQLCRSAEPDPFEAMKRRQVHANGYLSIGDT
jgi:hypothetical protein